MVSPDATLPESIAIADAPEAASAAPASRANDLALTVIAPPPCTVWDALAANVSVLPAAVARKLVVPGVPFV